MPGYEPFLLCDFHVHTTWSDGRVSLRDVVDLYGQTERFDVLAITDHILGKKDMLARLGRIATLGQRRFSVTSSDSHKAKHLYSWKTLVRSTKTWPAVRTALKSNVDVAITLFRRHNT